MRGIQATAVGHGGQPTELVKASGKQRKSLSLPASQRKQGASRGRLGKNDRLPRPWGTGLALESRHECACGRRWLDWLAAWLARRKRRRRPLLLGSNRPLRLCRRRRYGIWRRRALSPPRWCASKTTTGRLRKL